MIPLSTLISHHMWRSHNSGKSQGCLQAMRCWHPESYRCWGFSVITLHHQGTSLGHGSICGASDTLLAGSVMVQKLESFFFFFSLGVGVPGHSLLSPWAMVLTGHTTLMFLFQRKQRFGWVSLFIWNEVRCSAHISPRWPVRSDLTALLRPASALRQGCGNGRQSWARWLRHRSTFPSLTF